MPTSSTARRRRLAPLVLAAVMAVSAGVAAPSEAAAWGDGRDRLADTPAAAAKPFRLNLYRDGDFVSQTNLVQCVGASMQMMLNMMRPKDDRSGRGQFELQALARELSPRFGGGGDRVGQVRQRRGASSRGWAAGLTKLGYGPYRVTSEKSVEAAVRLAAVWMRRTGRPAGLLVWHGAHAWVMSGFEATADPVLDPGARITHVFVQDPLYPRASNRWGRMAPNTKLSLQALSADFVRWRPGRARFWSGRYVVVIPFVRSTLSPAPRSVAA